MGGGASQGAGSQQDPVDLTGGRGESSSQNVSSSSHQTNAPTAAEACNSSFHDNYHLKACNFPPGCKEVLLLGLVPNGGRFAIADE